jgi:outer membrane lipoprotein SlyB
MQRLIAFTAALALALGLLGACATTAPGESISGTGTVVSIQETMQASQSGSVVGAIGGALLGAALGSQIGGGSGSTIAATVGGVGGSMAGSSAGAKAGEKMVWRVAVRFDDGIDRTVTVSERPTYRPGDKVRVQQGVITPMR